MEQPKFILTSRGFFRLGMVRLHKDLLQPGELCYGGGYYEFDYVGNRLLLHGQSYDFGRPRWEWMPVLKIPKAYRDLRIVYQSSKSWEDDFVVTDELAIEFY